MFKLNAGFVALAAAVAASAQTPPFGGQSHISANINNGYCLTAAGSNNGDIVNVEQCDAGSANQDWTFQDGQVQIFGGSKCLDVTNGANEDGTLLQVWDCISYNTNQQWYYTGDNRLAWTNHGKCLDATNGQVYNGARPQIWTCFDNNSNQVWNAYPNFEGATTTAGLPAQTTSSTSTFSPFTSVITSTATTTLTEAETTQTLTTTLTTSVPVTTTPTVPVTFFEQADTVDGEDVYVVGSVDALGNFNTDNAILMTSAGTAQSARFAKKDLDEQFTVTLDLPASTVIQYMFLGKVDGQIVFQSEISELTTPDAGSEPVTENNTSLYATEVPEVSTSASDSLSATDSTSTTDSALTTQSISTTESASNIDSTTDTSITTSPTMSESSTSTTTTSASSSTSTGPTTPVQFNQQAEVIDGETMYVSGNIPALGNNDPNQAVLMSSVGEPAKRSFLQRLRARDMVSFTVTVDLPLNTTLEYNFIGKGVTGDVIYTSSTATFTTPDEASDEPFTQANSSQYDSTTPVDPATSTSSVSTDLPTNSTSIDLPTDMTSIDTSLPTDSSSTDTTDSTSIESIIPTDSSFTETTIPTTSVDLTNTTSIDTTLPTDSTSTDTTLPTTSAEV